MGPAGCREPVLFSVRKGHRNHLKTAHESLQIWELIQALGLKHPVLVQDIIGEEVHKGELEGGQ